jgi:hypothetical protein
MSEWIKCYRLAMRSHVLEAKRAEGGERFGFTKMFKAKKGEWLCRNPANDHRWVVSDEAFEELYCEIGKRPKKKRKKQEDGHRKGESRRMSSSSENENYGSLFDSGVEKDEKEQE